VEGSEVVDYARLLAHAGFLLEADSLRPYLGGSFVADSTGVFVNWSAANGSLFPAGINNGDVIVAIDGVALRTPDELTAEAARKRVGEVVELEVIQRTGRHTIPVPLVGRAALRVVPFEAAGRQLTTEQRTFRAEWLD
jgi:predicted metalloprotease with PDZ domain